jgi:hypothetical protein
MMPEYGTALYNKVIKNEESLQSLIAITVMFLILISYGVAGMLDWYFIAGMVAYIIVLSAIVKFLEARGKYRVDKRPDERTARITQVAARNGYLMALLAIGVVDLISSTGYVMISLHGALVILFVFMVSVQFISYLYYLGRGAAG